jgi:hypothetical protein
MRNYLRYGHCGFDQGWSSNSPKAAGTINYMWFQVIDIGLPGPDRGEGAKYLHVPLGYEQHILEKP